MALCQHTSYDHRQATAAVKRRQNSVAYQCKACDRIHVTTKDQAAGRLVLFANRHGDFIVYLDGQITDVT